MGVAAPRAPVSGWGPKPPQKFCHGFSFLGNCYLKKVSQKKKGKPRPLNSVINKITKKTVQQWCISVVHIRHTLHPARVDNIQYICYKYKDNLHSDHPALETENV